jgi:hypothetical protein
VIRSELPTENPNHRFGAGFARRKGNSRQELSPKRHSVINAAPGPNLHQIFIGSAGEMQLGRRLELTARALSMKIWRDSLGIFMEHLHSAQQCLFTYTAFNREACSFRF